MQSTKNESREIYDTNEPDEPAITCGMAFPNGKVSSL